VQSFSWVDNILLPGEHAAGRFDYNVVIANYSVAIKWRYDWTVTPRDPADAWSDVDAYVATRSGRWS
jgi:hypothetical protein